MGHKSPMFQILHSTKNIFIYIYNFLYLIHISIISWIKYTVYMYHDLFPSLSFVQVNLTSLEHLKTMAVQNGASSLQSVELQLSLEQMMELC